MTNTTNYNDKFLNFLKEWDNIPNYDGVEAVEKAVHKIFARWERNNLKITYGYRERTVANTYGLPYTSSSEFACIGNTNVTAVYKHNESYSFDLLAINEDLEVIAMLTDDEENEMFIAIGKLNR